VSAILESLEDLVYLASRAESPEDRRRLELALRQTATYVETREEQREAA